MPFNDLKDLSDRQVEYIRALFASEKANQLAFGSVRSGKNFAGAIALSMYLRFEPYGYEKSDFIFCGASIKAVYRILLRDIFDLVGPENYEYRSNDGSGRIFDREFYSFGFTNANSHHPMRGISAGGVAGTEATFMHPEFYDEIQARLSYPGAKALLDTNPGPPTHYLKKNIDDPAKRAEIELHHFVLQHNPWIMRDPAYIRRLYAMYPPGTMTHKRMILGEWAAAEGLVFDSFSDRHLIARTDLPKHYDRKVVGIDYGTQNACVFHLVGIIGRHYYFIRSYRYSGREEGVQQTTGQYLQDLLAFVRGEDIEGYYPDPSAAPFITEMDQADLLVEEAYNAVLPGIELMKTAFAEGRIHICKEDCPGLQQEIPGYVWDTKAGEKGKEQPVKKADHDIDAARYVVATLEDQAVDGSAWDEFERRLRLEQAA